MSLESYQDNGEICTTVMYRVVRLLDRALLEPFADGFGLRVLVEVV